MGKVIVGKCNCGYKSNKLVIGAGKSHYKTVTYVPSLDYNSEEITSVNILQDNSELFVLPYTDLSLHDCNCNCGEMKTLDTKINRDGNFCPKCKEFTLFFSLLYLFD